MESSWQRRHRQLHPIGGAGFTFEFIGSPAAPRNQLIKPELYRSCESVLILRWCVALTRGFTDGNASGPALSAAQRYQVWITDNLKPPTCCRVGGLSEMIISLYAADDDPRLSAHMKRTLGTGRSPTSTASPGQIRDRTGHRTCGQDRPPVQHCGLGSASPILLERARASASPPFDGTSCGIISPPASAAALPCDRFSGC
jgi:hypothetical protein